MATMATMTPNSDDAASGDEGNKDTKWWQRQQRQRRTKPVINPAEAQDATIVLMAVPQWSLCHHTVVSHRIDPMGEYIENLDPKSGLQKNLDRLAGQPIQICYKITKKRPCTQSGFAKKRTLEQKSCKKKEKKTQQIELRQAPICTYSRFILCLFWSKSGSKPFRPISIATHY